MVTMTVYADGEGICKIKNNLQGNLMFTERIEVALKKTRKYPYEIQVPIMVVGNIYPKKNQGLLFFEDKRD